jgi:CBS domain-containing protein
MDIMPSSYQAPTRGEKRNDSSTSQSIASNLGYENASVDKILAIKGTDVFSIRPEDTLADAVVLLREKRIGALVVTDSAGKLVGILSERDIVRKLAETPGETLPKKVAEVMTSKIETCTEDEMIVSVLSRMSKGRFRHMPVMADDQLRGMVTIGDVVNYRLLQLEHEALQLKQLIVG